MANGAVIQKSFISKPSFEGQALCKRQGPIAQRVGIPLEVEGVSPGQIVPQSSRLDIHLPLCVQNNANPKRGVDIRMQKQTLHC